MSALNFDSRNWGRSIIKWKVCEFILKQITFPILKSNGSSAVGYDKLEEKIVTMVINGRQNEIKWSLSNKTERAENNVNLLNFSASSTNTLKWSSKRFVEQTTDYAGGVYKNMDRLRR